MIIITHQFKNFGVLIVAVGAHMHRILLLIIHYVYTLFYIITLHISLFKVLCNIFYILCLILYLTSKGFSGAV